MLVLCDRIWPMGGTASVILGVSLGTPLALVIGLMWFVSPRRYPELPSTLPTPLLALTEHVAEPNLCCSQLSLPFSSERDPRKKWWGISGDVAELVGSMLRGG